MNVKTNFCGAVWLASTIGKNGFAAGEVISKKAQDVYFFTRENLVEWEADIALVGKVKVFENLEKASKWSEEKCKEASATCKEWQKQADKKYLEAEVEENLYEYLRKLNNQPTDFERVCKLAKKVGDKLINLTARQIGKTKRFLNSVAKKWWPAAKVKDIVRCQG